MLLLLFEWFSRPYDLRLYELTYVWIANATVWTVMLIALTCRQLCGVVCVYWFLLTWPRHTTDSHWRHEIIRWCMLSDYNVHRVYAQYTVEGQWHIQDQVPTTEKQQNNIQCVLRTERLRLTYGYFKRDQWPSQTHWIISLQCCGSLLCTTRNNRQYLSYACLHCS